MPIYLRCMQRLPLQDLLPGLFIVLVVDFDDVAHVGGSEVIFAPAPPGCTITQNCLLPDNAALATGFVQCKAKKNVRADVHLEKYIMSYNHDCIEEEHLHFTDPFLSMAFQNICSDGYTQCFSVPWRGIADSSLARDNLKGWSGAGVWFGGGI